MANSMSWQCPACTLINAASRSTCEVCSEACPVKGNGQPVLHLNHSITHSGNNEEAKVNAPLASGQGASAQPGIGLSAVERRAREEEMVAKRQKKEEEKKRILKQAEDDRRSRMQEVGAQSQSGDALFPDSEQQQQQRQQQQQQQQQQQRQQQQEQQAKAMPQTARLQFRCPQWNRNIVFSCFSPSTPLGDVRRCLREELVIGISGVGDGTAVPAGSAAEAKVPPEVDIMLVESVPPRRKLTSAEDMQKTLLELGLCPSSTLLVDAAPITAAQEPVLGDAPGSVGDGHDEHAEAAGSASDQDSGAESDEQEEEDEDEDENEDSDPGFAGGMGTGTFGSNGPRRPYGGTFGANWRFGQQSAPSKKTGPRIGPGGELLGSGTIAGSSAPGGSTEDQRAVREARLAALERRNCMSTGEPSAVLGHPESMPPPTEAPQPAVTSISESVLNKAIPPDCGKKRKEAEKAEILRRIAEERQDFNKRHVPVQGGGTSSSSEHVAAASQPKATPSTRANVAPVGGAARSEGLPSDEQGRVKGQMGGIANKGQRQQERQQILQKLAEDRSSYDDRHKTAAEISSASEAATTGVARGMVRLQLRCATSGRMVTTTSFEAGTAMRDVFAYASAELSPGTGEGNADGLGSAITLQLAYPPRTAFTAAEHAGTSLGDLGLCPSATLLVKSECKPSTSVGEDERNASNAADQVSTAPGASNVRPACPNNHEMSDIVAAEDVWCDMCQQGMAAGDAAYECKTCDYIQCQACTDQKSR